MHININLGKMIDKALDGRAKLKDYEKSKLRAIEREAERGELECEEIIAGLKKIDTIKETLSSRDFDDLEKKINKIL